MGIQYTWEISDTEVLDNVVVSIKWKCIGTVYGTMNTKIDGNKHELVGKTNICYEPDPNEPEETQRYSSFVPADQVNQEILLRWVWENGNSKNISENFIFNQLVGESQ